MLNRRTKVIVSILVIVAITILLFAPTVPVNEKAPTIYPNYVIVHELKSPACLIFGEGFTYTYSDGSLYATCNMRFI